MEINEMMVDRAQGCLFGQVIGDSLGGLVEFKGLKYLRSTYPNGVRDMHDGGKWNIMAGQCTDDSEMALALARSLERNKGFNREDVKASYVRWARSRPFDIGSTTSMALLEDEPSQVSQSNGCLMRISPLGVWGATKTDDELAAAAHEDTAITHLNELAQQVSELFVVGIAHAIRGESAEAVFECVADRAKAINASKIVLDRIAAARTDRPGCYEGYAPDSAGNEVTGWAMVAFHNAFYQLLHAKSVEEGIVDTIDQYGDTDTNAAIAGALLGAARGAESIPERWRRVILDCRPGPDMQQEGRTLYPRPREYWPCDINELALLLLSV